MATIPVNLDAAKKIGTPEDIREVVIPLGATIHMEGSCLAAIVKIAFLFGVFQMPFTGLDVWATAAIIAVLCGTVISGIPSGGVLGELLIVTLYNFPVEALPLITMDPEKRTMMQVKLDDAVAAEDIFSVLMGEDVESRKEFLRKHALEVDNLDI